MFELLKELKLDIKSDYVLSKDVEILHGVHPDVTYIDRFLSKELADDCYKQLNVNLIVSEFRDRSILDIHKYVPEFHSTIKRRDPIISRDFKLERYVHFQRLSPNTLEGFISSKLFDVCYLLQEYMIEFSKSKGIANPEVETLVCQNIPRGCSMSKHSDSSMVHGLGARVRLYSFLYYLTDDSYTDGDGGRLQIHKSKDDDEVVESFSPLRNRLIIFDLKDGYGPYHSLTKYNSDKYRFALVGYIFNK